MTLQAHNFAILFIRGFTPWTKCIPPLNDDRGINIAAKRWKERGEFHTEFTSNCCKDIIRGIQLSHNISSVIRSKCILGKEVTYWTIWNNGGNHWCLIWWLWGGELVFFFLFLLQLTFFYGINVFNNYHLLKDSSFCGSFRRIQYDDRIKITFSRKIFYHSRILSSSNPFFVNTPLCLASKYFQNFRLI